MSVSLALFRHSDIKGSPLHLLSLITLDQAAAALSCSSVSFHTVYQIYRTKRVVPVHIIMLRSVGFFKKNVFPPTVYNHLDAVILCRDLYPDPPCIVEGKRFLL